MSPRPSRPRLGRDLPAGERERLLADVGRRELVLSVDGLPPGRRDPDDDAIEAEIRAEAGVIVKGDEDLLAPPARVAGYDTPYPYAQDRAYLPGTNRILRAVQGVLDY